MQVAVDTVAAQPRLDFRLVVAVELVVQAIPVIQALRWDH
jgi:hypothetical protein